MTASFNLALFVPLPGIETLRYLFVPAQLEAFSGYEQFSAVWLDARPAGCVLARSSGLASLRAYDTPAGRFCPAERATIEDLIAAANRGGHRLPPIAPTLGQPLWAGSVLEVPRRALTSR